MESLKGPFKDIIPQFQNYKKSLGYLYDNISSFIQLDIFLYNHGIYDFNDTKLIFEVLIKNEPNLSKRKNRYTCLQQLYEFMKLLGYHNLYFENIQFDKNSNFIPKILNTKEITLFFKKIDQLSILLDNNEQYIYPTLFRLLYSSGLRINEALKLKITDISLKNGTVNIVKGKGNIARLIPLSPTMKCTLTNYLKIVNCKTYLFEINNKPITYIKVSDFFHRITNKMFDFRIHDLRHTFAVTVFNNLYKKGLSEYQILYLLHIYMGHTNIKSTEYYLRMTDETYNRILNNFHNKYPNVIPKVGDMC